MHHRVNNRDQAFSADVDVTERMWSPFFDASSGCVKLLSPQGAVRRINAVGRTALGLENAPELGMNWVDLLPRALQNAGYEALRRAASGHDAKMFGTTESELAQYTWNSLLTPVYECGVLTGILCTSRDVSREHARHIDAIRRSEIDELTQLGSRRSILAVLRRSLENAQLAGTSVGVAMIDVDDLKTINDTLGHRAGDDALVRVAAAIRDHAAPDWYAGRLGGDEFLVVAPAAHRLALCPQYDVLERALRRIPGLPVVHASIGTATGEGVRTAADLMAEADERLYDDKRRHVVGRGYYLDTDRRHA